MTVHRRFLHASLNHRANKRATARNLAERISELDVDYCHATEGRWIHVLILRRTLAPEYGVGKRGEYLFIFRRAALQRRSKLLVGPAVMVTATRRIAAWRQTWLGGMQFWDAEAATYLLGVVAHFPGGVQRGDGWKTTSRRARAQVRTAQAAWPKVGSYMRRRAWANETRNWVGWLSYDGNQHLGRPAWRKWQRGQLGGIPAWTSRTLHGQPGTHAGGRIIDGAHGYGDVRILDVNVDRAPNPGDHQFVIFDVEYPVERRRRPHKVN